MLEELKRMVIFAQGRDVFIYDYMDTVEYALDNLEFKYVNPETAYAPANFPQLCEYIENYSYAMQYIWLPDMNTGVDFFNFRIG
jgi:hypothetical protein